MKISIYIKSMVSDHYSYIDTVDGWLIVVHIIQNIRCGRIRVHINGDHTDVFIEGRLEGVRIAVTPME